MVSAPPGYRFVVDLASGGMGDVTLVLRQQGTFERLLVCKRVRDSGADADRGMLLEEARIAGLVHHANVVSVVDAGIDDDGPYIIMAYVHGLSLGELIAAASRSGRLLPVQLCLRLAAQVARGLHAAHEARDGDVALGLVHRDVSPQNVLLGDDGVVQLADFGIAKELHSGSKTRTGLLKGKPGYMSPEQLRFEEVDRRADLYALGVVLFEALASRRMHASEDMTAVARAVLHDPPPDICDERPDVPPRVNELLFRLLAKDRSHRPATAAEVAEVLTAEADDLAIDEGVIDVASFVAEHHAEELASRRAAVDVAMTRANRPQPVIRSSSSGLRWGLAVALAGGVAIGWTLLPKAPASVSVSRGLVPSVSTVTVDAAPPTSSASTRPVSRPSMKAPPVKTTPRPAVKPLPTMWPY